MKQLWQGYMYGWPEAALLPIGNIAEDEGRLAIPGAWDILW
jgi:hypothetical protein